MTSIAIDRTDGLSSSVAIKGPCRAATTANITMSGEQTIDGVAVVTDDRVLVKDQTTTSENGIYVVDTGAWRRAKDFSRTNDVKLGTKVFVVLGTVNVRSEWFASTFTLVGDDAIAFTRSNQVSTAFMTTVNSSADDAAEARDLLGILDQTAYATRTLLKAIVPLTNQIAGLAEAGREGTFVFRAGDYSTHIAADVAEGVYIKADTIAANVGAWVRLAGYAISGYDLDWFGRVDGNTTAGVTENNSAIESAFDIAFMAGGGKVVLPVGRTRLDPFTIPANVWLCGATQGPWTAGGYPMDNGYAPILLVNSIATDFITLGPAGAGQVAGQVSDIFFWYPDSGANPVQNPPTSATPIDTKYCVSGANSGWGGYRVNRCTFGNAYDGVKILAGRSIISNNAFGCFRTAIYLDYCRDWIVINDNMNQVFWDTFNGLSFPQTIDTWVMNNSVCLEVFSVDSLEVNGWKLFARYMGMRFQDSPDTGQAIRNAYGRFVNIDLDYVAYGMQIVSANNTGGGHKFTNMDIAANASGVGSAGAASIITSVGGIGAPLVQWLGGSVRGSWTAGVTTVSLAAGVVLVKDIHGLTPYGLIGPPAVPATTVALTNPYPFDCEVNVNGGTVTVIAIQGGTTGKTSGTFHVGAGKTIAITYTVVPTWTWFGI